MDWKIGTVLVILTAVASAQEPPETTKLGDWKKECARSREAMLATLDKKELPVPDGMVRAREAELAAYEAWHAKQWDEARRLYRESWVGYAAATEASRAQQAKLEGLREKKPPAPDLPSRTRKPIAEALAWLAAHQDPIGRWDCDGFAKHDDGKGEFHGPGKAQFDVGVTALALLAFLDAGFTDRDNHYALEVRRGLNWLLLQQDESGSFGTGDELQYYYRHVLAAFAVTRAYARTKDERFAAPLKRAVEYTLRARQGAPGWRYQVGGGESDTSLTSWSYRFLRAAKEAGLEFDMADAEAGTRTWIDSCTQPDGRIGYVVGMKGDSSRPEGLAKFTADRTRSMTAAGTVARILLQGEEPDEKTIHRSLDQCLSRPPAWNDDGDVDMYYWYVGSLACRFEKSRARKWRKALHKAVLKHQERKGVHAGSWAPVGPWGPDGGRVYSTAIVALAILHAG
jgi:hypothetical protein